MSKEKYLRSFATDEELNLFRKNVLEHQNFFSNLRSHVNEEDTSKKPGTYGVKYSDLVQFAIEGDMNAARIVSSMVYYGTYFPQDKSKAKEVLYGLAFGVEGHIDPSSAYHYSRLLLNEKEFKACNTILEDLMNVDYLPAFALKGNIYEYGYGTEVDVSEANRYYKLASKGGHLYAKFLRGKLYLRKPNIFSKLYGLTILFRAMIWAFYINTLGKKTPDLRLTY